MTIALLCIPALLDLFRVPRIPPDFSSWSLSSGVLAMPEMANWFAALRLAGFGPRIVQALFFLAAALGVLIVSYRLLNARSRPTMEKAASRLPEARAVALLALLAWPPATILSLLSTTNVVYQRYALFAMPAYFLLVGYGLACWYRAFPLGSPARRTLSNFAKGMALVAAGAFTVASVFSTPVAVRHDYRAVARYLVQNAQPDDTAVFLGTDQTVAQVYWRGKPPLTAISALDPRISELVPAADVYWLVGYEHPVPLAHKPPNWRYLGDHGGLSLYHEPRGGQSVDIVGGMAEAADWLARAGTGDPVLAQVASSLRGSTLQARGDFEAAARAYREAGTLYPIGGEYQITSEEFERRGETESAWLDAIMSKSMQPERPDLHRWLATLLERDGRAELAEQERSVARVLEELR
jgi:hypothetical protein